MQFTMRAMREAPGLQFLHEYLRPAVVVVERLLALRQPARLGLHEAALDEPMRGARGEDEDRLETHRARLRFRVGEQALAAPAVAVEGIRRERREVRGLAVREGIERRA